MDEVLKLILVQVGYYAAVMFLTFFVLNFVTHGFLFTFLRVKMSRGKKVLLKVHNSMAPYFRVCVVVDDTVRYKDKKKEIRTIALPTNGISRFLGVSWCEVDEVKNCVLKTDFSVVPGFDSVRFDYLLTRALMKPQIMDLFQKIILVLCIVIIIGVGIDVYFAVKGGKLLQIIADNSQFLVEQAKFAQMLNASGGVLP